MNYTHIKQIGRFHLFDDEGKIIAMRAQYFKKKIFGKIVEGYLPRTNFQFIFKDMQQAEIVLNQLA